MKQLLSAVILIVMFSVFMPNAVMSTNDGQLITEIKVVDNDSVFRYLYLYDNLGNKVLETKYFQQDSTWVRKSLIEWIYNGNNCITQRERSWKDNNWLITFTIDYDYTGNRLNSEIQNIYNKGIPALFKKIEYQYKSTLLTSKKEFAWDQNNWNLSIENDFSYLPDGKTDSITTTNYQSGSTNNQILSTFIYNADGTLQSELLQEKTVQDWVNTELINWFYTDNSSLVSSLRNKKWLSESSSWENTQRIDYSYNNSILVSETYQRWKSQFWDNDIRYDYEYDSNNLLLKKTLSEPIYHDWRGVISIYYSNFKQNKANNIDSKFDFWGGVTDDLTTSYIPFMFNDQLSIQKGRSLSISYVPVDDTSLFTPVKNNPFNMIPVYPNPSIGIFYINTQKYSVDSWSVTDLKGQVLRRQVQSFQSGVIDISDFPKGVYILHVTTPEGQMIQKLIKE